MSEPPPKERRSSPGDEQGRWRTALGDAGPYLGLGLQIAVTMAVYVGAGLGLDAWLDTLPFLTIAGALVGMGTAFYQVVRAAEEMGQGGKGERREQSNGEERPKGT